MKGSRQKYLYVNLPVHAIYVEHAYNVLLCGYMLQKINVTKYQQPQNVLKRKRLFNHSGLIFEEMIFVVILQPCICSVSVPTISKQTDGLN